MDFPGDPVVENLLANAGKLRFDPCSGKIPHATGQLILCATTTKSVRQLLKALSTSEDPAQTSK